MPLHDFAQDSHPTQNSVNMSENRQLRFYLQSLRLNQFSQTLLFFTFLLFLIATNTQSGWLFVLISLLLSLVIVDGIQVFFTATRAVANLKLTIKPEYTDTYLTPAVNGGYVGNYDHIYSFYLRLDNQSSKAFVNIQIYFDNQSDSIVYTLDKTKSLPLTLQPNQETMEPSPTTLRVLTKLYNLKTFPEIDNLSKHLKQEGEVTAETSTNTMGNRLTVIIDNIGPHKATKLNYKIRIKQRGRYSAAPSAFRFYSYLGMVSCTLSVDLNFCPLYIAPEMVDLKPAKRLFRTAHTPNEYMPKKSLNETENFYGLHEFRIGENIRHIHWATSARMGNLMVREFQVDPPQEKKYPVLINIMASTNYATTFSQVPYALEMALLIVNSIAELCKKESREIAVLFHTNKGPITICESSKLNYPLKQFLAEVTLTSEPKFTNSHPPQQSAEYIKNYLSKKYDRVITCQIALHPHIDLELCDNGCAIFLFIQSPDIDQNTTDEFALATLVLKRKGINAHCITIQDDLEEILEGCIQ